MRIKSGILWALLLVVPFLFLYPTDFEPIRTAKQAGILFLGGIALSAFLISYVPVSLALCLGYVVSSASLTGMGPAQEHTALAVLAASFIAVLFSGGLEAFARKGLIALVFASSLESIWGLVQYAGLDPIFTYHENLGKLIPVGTMGQQTLLGPFIVTGAIACVSLGGWYLLALIFILPTIFLADSSFTYASLFIGMAFMFRGYLANKKALISLLFAGAAALTALPKDFINNLLMDNGRFMLWREVCALYGRFSWTQKLVGLGGGSFGAIFPGYQSAFLSRQSGAFLQAHNDYLEVLFEFGAIGMFLLSCLLFEAGYFLKSLRLDVWSEENAWGAILVSLMINSIGNFPMRLEPHGAIALLAFIFIATKDRQPVYLDNGS